MVLYFIEGNRQLEVKDKVTFGGFQGLRYLRSLQIRARESYWAIKTPK